MGLNIISFIDLSCSVFIDGIIIVMGIGGVILYIYVWSNGVIGEIIFGFGVGIYIVMMIDVSGCEFFVEVMLIVVDDF